MQLGFEKPLSSVLQIEIKRFLESVYGLKVEQVRTLNYEGKKKRRKTGFFRQSDYKKVSARRAFRQQITDALSDSHSDSSLSHAFPSHGHKDLHPPREARFCSMHLEHHPCIYKLQDKI